MCAEKGGLLFGRMWEVFLIVSASVYGEGLPRGQHDASASTS